MDQWNWIKDPDINLHNYEHLILDKKQKLYSGKKKASSTNVAGMPGCQHVADLK